MILHNVCVANNFYRDIIFRDLLQCGVDKTNKINRTNSISIAALITQTQSQFVVTKMISIDCDELLEALFMIRVSSVSLSFCN